MRANRAVRLFWAVVLVVFGSLAEIGAEWNWPSAPVDVMAAPFQQAGGPQLSIFQPAANEVVQSTLNMQVEITSTFDLVSVTAAVDDRQTSLTFSQTGVCRGHPGGPSPCSPGWAGSISLDGLTTGPKTLTVTALDIQGHTGTATQTFRHATPPSIFWSSPADDDVARPSARFFASCIDDDAPNCTVNVLTSELGLLATGKGSIDQTVSLEAMNGDHFLVSVQVVDSDGLFAALSRPIYVDASRRLQEVFVGDEPIIDADATRVLVGGNSLPLKLVDRQTNLVTPIAGLIGDAATVGYLTPRGAILATSGGGRVQEWRDGALLDVDSLEDQATLQVNGSFAIWHRRAPESDLVRRDLDTGTIQSIDTDIAPAPGPGYVTRSANVGPNGDVVYVKNNDNRVFRWRNGSSTPLAAASTPHTNPRTDGINVTALALTPAGCISFAQAPKPCRIDLIDATTETSLGSGLNHFPVNGFIAFDAVSPGGVLQAWLREQDGQLRQLSNLATNTTVEGVGQDGNAVVRRDTRRLLISHGQTLDASTPVISTTFGRLKEAAGRWYIILARSLARVTEQEQPRTPPLPAVNRVPTTISVTEGSAQTFAIGLSTIPLKPVTVTFVYDTSKLVVQPPSITFPSNGAALGAQTVTVAAPDDTVLQGNRTVPIHLAVSSSDAAYNNLPVEDEQVTIVDNEAPASCSPRPRVQVQTAAQNGALQVTVSATSPAGLSNALRSLTWTSLTNTTVTVTGVGPVSQGQVTNLPTGAQTATFQVRRVTAGQPTTVRFTVSDACGDWPTFVGGGPSAF